MSEFFKNGELDDKKIVEELHKDVNAYENGEIIEVRDSLAEIINSIDEFIALN